MDFKYLIFLIHCVFTGLVFKRAEILTTAFGKLMLVSLEERAVHQWPLLLKTNKQDARFVRIEEYFLKMQNNIK